MDTNSIMLPVVVCNTDVQTLPMRISAVAFESAVDCRTLQCTAEAKGAPLDRDVENITAKPTYKKAVFVTATLTISVFKNREVDPMYLNQKGVAPNQVGFDMDSLTGVGRGYTQ